jgi:hypothetical protein
MAPIRRVARAIRNAQSKLLTPMVNHRHRNQPGKKQNGTPGAGLTHFFETRSKLQIGVEKPL